MLHDYLGKTKAELLVLLDEARAAGDKIRGRLIHDHLVTSHGWQPDEAAGPGPTVQVPKPAAAPAAEAPAAKAKPEVPDGK